MYTNTPFEGMSRAEGGHPFIGLGLGSRGAYTQGGSICIPGVGLPDIYLLPRREKYTRVYTFVYPRVHNSVQACTQHRSRYVPARALWYVLFKGLPLRTSSDTAKDTLGREVRPPKSPKAGASSLLPRRGESIRYVRLRCLT